MSSLFDSMGVSASGLAVQQERVHVASENLANMSSTRTPEGGPYVPRSVMVSSAPLSFDRSLSAMIGGRTMQGVEVVGVVKKDVEPKELFDPSHPDANDKGYVSLPNINATQEMIDVMTASKAYEANITVMNATKMMMMRTLDIGG